MAIQQQLSDDVQKQREVMEALLGKSRTTKGMKIKKIGHCCLVIETKGVRILTDPGSFTTAQDEEKNIDIVLITHEHGDHFHIESIKKIVANNPEAVVVTNGTVGALLDKEGIAYTTLEHGANTTLHDILLEGFGEHHAVIYKDMGQTQNTGYFIDNTLFYPGDALTNPSKPIDILALPTAGPFLKLAEVVEYAFALKPKRAFPVHDAVMRSPEMFNQWIGGIIASEGIEFIPLNAGEEHDFS